MHTLLALINGSEQLKDENTINNLKVQCTCVLYDVVDLFALSQVIHLQTVIPVTHTEQQLGIMGYCE